MMGWAGAVVLIVLIVTIGKVMSRRYSALARYNDAQTENRGSADEVRRLKERIAVLERVITDNHGSHDLDREIERLRDHQEAAS